jgi:hypothetical protein
MTGPHHARTATHTHSCHVYRTINQGAQRPVLSTAHVARAAPPEKARLLRTNRATTATAGGARRPTDPRTRPEFRGVPPLLKVILGKTRVERLEGQPFEKARRIPQSKTITATGPRPVSTPSKSDFEELRGSGPHWFTDQQLEAQPAEGTVGTADAPRSGDLLISGSKPSPRKARWAPQMPLDLGTY